MSKDQLKVALAQISPVWINREKTLEKVIEYTSSAASEDARLVVFGEALLPGYPFWIDRTNGAQFDSKVQKEIHAHYMDQAVSVEEGHLKPVLTEQQFFMEEAAQAHDYLQSGEGMGKVVISITH